MRCDFFTHEGYGSDRARCPQCTPDLPTMTINEPGPIRLEAMADSRKLRWRRADPPEMVELGKVYIGTRYAPQEKVWILVRVRWCEECGHWEAEQDAGLHDRSHQKVHTTHFAEDILGTP